MTYRRSFSTVISGTVSYPPSKDGGTTSWSEVVTVNVTVADDPFQAEVQTLAQHVDLATGSIVATEAAQIVSKRQGAEEIGHRLTHGFQDLIRREIEQQMVEVSTLMAAKLVELQALADRCAALREQMRLDFRRIQSRYLKLFADLDAELRLRIHRVDAGVFRLQESTAAQSLTGERSRPALQSTLGAQEESSSRAALVGHTFRSRTRDVLHSAHRLISGGRALRHGIQTILRSSPVEGRTTVYVPVLLHESDGSTAGVQVEVPPFLRQTSVADRCQGASAPITSGLGWGRPTPPAWQRVTDRATRRLGDMNIPPRHREMALKLLMNQGTMQPLERPR